MIPTLKESKELANILGARQIVINTEEMKKDEFNSSFYIDILF